MTSLKPNYDRDNPEHTAYFMNHKVSESMQYFNSSSLQGVYKNRGSRELEFSGGKKGRKRKLPPEKNRGLNTEVWEREEMTFGDMKPLPGFVFGQIYE